MKEEWREGFSIKKKHHHRLSFSLFSHLAMFRDTSVSGKSEKRETDVKLERREMGAREKNDQRMGRNSKVKKRL